MGKYLDLISKHVDGTRQGNQVQKDDVVDTIDPDCDQSDRSDQSDADELDTLRRWHATGVLKALPSMTIDLSTDERHIENPHGTVSSWLLEVKIGEEMSSGARHRLKRLHDALAPMIEENQ